jgi:sarcosine oxidase
VKSIYDIIVIGLGANGSSALYHLSKSGQRVLGIDQFQPPHQRGSSHGESRIIRQAYHENPLYVPLVKAAYPLWEQLERLSGKRLFIRTGGLLLGSEEAGVVKGAKASAEMHGIPYEYLRAAELRKRFPAFRPDGETVGVLEKEAGVLFPELCIAAYLEAASSNGAVVNTLERVLEIEPSRDSVIVTTTAGRYSAEKVIVSAGAWLGSLLPGLRLPLTIERQVLYWFENANAGWRGYFQPSNMPIFIWEHEIGKMFYGFPDLGRGVKIGFHHGGQHILADELKQEVSASEIAEMGEMAERYLSMEPIFKTSTVCMYTNTPDENFIIDFHPEHRNILIASPCSGHGFKFSSLTGQLLCKMVMGEPTGFDLEPFKIAGNRYF